MITSFYMKAEIDNDRTFVIDPSQPDDLKALSALSVVDLAVLDTLLHETREITSWALNEKKRGELRDQRQ